MGGRRGMRGGGFTLKADILPFDLYWSPFSIAPDTLMIFTPIYYRMSTIASPRITTSPPHPTLVAFCDFKWWLGVGFRVHHPPECKHVLVLYGFKWRPGVGFRV